jgi:hypothetical protein
LKAVRRITKPIYPFNMNPTLDIDSGIGRFTVDEAQIVARKRRNKASAAKGFGWLWLRVRHPRLLDLIATVFVALYLVAAVALIATLFL